MLFACENDVNKVKLCTEEDSLPVVSIKDVELIYSDSGQVQILLTSKQLKKYAGKKPFTEFPKGFEILFFDSLKNIKSKITANYGISYDKRKIMEAKNNVVVINNEKNERLNTEHLVWDQNKRMIYSDVFVKIKQKDRELYGKGLESDETFNKWKILKPTGVFIFRQEEQDNN